MMRYFIFLFVFVFSLARGSAQNFSHFVSLQQSAGLNKRTSLLSYTSGAQNVYWSFSAGFASGTDKRTLSPAELQDDAARAELQSCQTFDIHPLPKNMFAEACNSSYSGKQLRAGFTVFLPRAAKNALPAWAGLHMGVEVAYMYMQQTQVVTYKSESEEQRLSYSNTSSFSELGAVTHVGWQFVFLNDHLCADVRAVLPFYYPFAPRINVNSPFAGTKYELQLGLGWHFTAPKKTASQNPGLLLRDHI